MIPLQDLQTYVGQITDPLRLATILSTDVQGKTVGTWIGLTVAALPEGPLVLPALVPLGIHPTERLASLSFEEAAWARSTLDRLRELVVRFSPTGIAAG